MTQEKMEKMGVGFFAGESRHSTKGVNYLLGGRFDDDEYIYAECELPEPEEEENEDGDITTVEPEFSDDYGYLTMKNALVKALQKAGISLDRFSFQYDGQEQYLAPDASAECRVQIEICVRKKVYSVIGSDAEMHYDGRKPPELTQESIEEALFGECTDISWTRNAEFDTKEEAVEYLKKHCPEMIVSGPSGNGVRFIPVSGSAVMEEEKIITIYDDDMDVEYDWCGIWEYSHYRPIVTNACGSRVDFEAAVPMMDDNLRERLHAQLAPCSPQEFFTAYEQAHEEEFGEEWELSKENPVW